MVEHVAEPAARSRRRRRLPRFGSPIAWAATVVFAGLMVVWSITTPQFRSPDEPSHVDGVLRIMEGRGWPAPGKALTSPEVLRAKTVSGFSAYDGQGGPWGGATMVPGVERTIPKAQLKYFALYSAEPVTPPDQRDPFSKLKVTRPVNLKHNIDQMTQHPPLYYAAEAGVLEAVGGGHLRYDRQLELMRLVSILMVAPLPLLAFSTARRLSGRRRVGDVAAVLPLGIPQLAAVGASVSNDALVILLGGVLVLQMAIMLTKGVSWRLVLGTGAVLGLALLTKGTLLLAVPVVGLALVVGARRRAARLSWPGVAARLAGTWGLAFAVGGWWWAVNVVRYGTLQPNGLAPLQTAVGGERLSRVAFAKPFASHLATSFWGQFGWLELPLPRALIIALSVVSLLAVALAFRRRATALPIGVLLLFPLLTLVLLYQQTYASHLRIGQFAGLQGRYLFGMVVVLAAGAAVGFSVLAPAGSRRERWLPVAALVAALGVAAYGLWFAFTGYYQEIGWTLRAAVARMLAWSPFPRWFSLALVIGLLVVAVVALGVAVHQALRRDRTALPPGAAAAPAAPESATPVPVREPELEGERSSVAVSRRETRGSRWLGVSPA